MQIAQMREMQEKVSARRRATGIAMLTLFLLCAYSMRPASFDNENTRFDLTFSIVFHHTTSIDAYHANTLDKAFKDGHYYCDKAPGLSYLAVPPLMALSKLFPSVAWHPDNPIARYLLRLFSITLLCTAMLPVMISLLKSAGLRAGGAMSSIYAAGSLAFPFMILFFGHQPSALCLATVFLLVMMTYDNEKIAIHTGIFAGLAGGAAVLFEYPAGAPAAILLAAMFFRRGYKHKGGIVLGVFLPAMMLMAYNTATFGSPFELGYAYEVHPYFKESMSHGLGGVTLPDPMAAARLLFGPQKGLFIQHPWLLSALPGFVILWRRDSKGRYASILSALGFLSVFLINASYYEPFGGSTPGPRFLVASIPFLVVPAGAAWEKSGVFNKGIIGGAALYSIVMFQMVTAIEPNVPYIFANPLKDFALVLLTRGYPLVNALTIGNLHRHLSVATITAAAAVFALYAMSRETKKLPALMCVNAAAVAVIITGALFFAPQLPSPPTTREKALMKYYTGTTYTMSKAHTQSAAFFREAIALDPGLSDAWFRLGIAQINIKNYNDAVVCFRQAIKLAPQNRQSYISLAAAQMIKGDTNAALDTARKALVLFPGDPALTGIVYQLTAQTE